MTNPLYTLECAISACHDITNNTHRRHVREAADKTKAGALADFVNGAKWEDGEDIIDNDQFRYGVEFADSYQDNFVREIIAIIDA
jgi:hypothetical protein